MVDLSLTIFRVQDETETTVYTAESAASSPTADTSIAGMSVVLSPVRLAVRPYTAHLGSFYL